MDFIKSLKRMNTINIYLKISVFYREIISLSNVFTNQRSNYYSMVFLKEMDFVIKSDVAEMYVHQKNFYKYLWRSNVKLLPFLMLFCFQKTTK